MASKSTVPHSAESEQMELEVVATALERTPKLARLLRYLVEKHFAGEGDQLTEYNIATEVFGRDETTFIASQDAVARVETHRLRKRLKNYYETEGQDHLVKISLPLGSYVPLFIWDEAQQFSDRESGFAFEDSVEKSSVLEKAVEPASASPTPPRNVEVVAASHAAPKPRGFIWIYTLAATAVLMALGGYTLIRARHSNSSGISVANRVESIASAPGSSNAAQPAASVPIPYRMIAGYSGPQQRDSMGDLWLADRYSRGGWGTAQPSVYLARTSDQMVFRYGRSGNFDYDIPLRQGMYELHLFFVDSTATFQPEDTVNLTSFNVTVNGTIALEDFDIDSDASGRNIADERVLRDITPAADGKLHLHFSTVTGTPSLSGIEILSGTPHKQLPIRIVMQTTPYTDSKGLLWHPDDFFQGGRILFHDAPNANSSDKDFISTERFGHFSYAIPVDSRGRYTITLHFAELFFGVETPGAPGKRVFRVICNGNTLLDNFDIYKEVGADHSLTKTFHHIVPTAQGKLNLEFEPIISYATISAIDVADDSE